MFNNNTGTTTATKNKKLKKNEDITIVSNRLDKIISNKEFTAECYNEFQKHLVLENTY